MIDTIKFPNGYEFNVVRKADILECIDKNIIDKDVAYALIEQLELDIVKYIEEGRWTGIPFIGNIRIPKHIKYAQSKEQKEAIEAAREVLDKERFIAFKKKLAIENYNRSKFDTYFNYVTSIIVKKNLKLYKKLIKEKGENYAKVYMFSWTTLKSENNEFNYYYGQ